MTAIKTSHALILDEAHRKRLGGKRLFERITGNGTIAAAVRVLAAVAAVICANTDLDDPIWDEYECGFNDDKERFRAVNRMNLPWRALRDGCTSENRDD